MAETDIAIIGMAAHLPGARNPADFWSSLRNEVESIRQLTDDQLLEAGVSKDALRRPGYVRASAILDDVFHFDAEFFGLSPKEAGIMDPQHRHFLMAAWEALEDAAHPPSGFDGAIGVFAGCGMNSYFMKNLMTNPDLVDDVGTFLLRHTGNDKDFLATRASYIFNLRGPSISVQTACSTSLVATHLAVQSLLSGECDLALAGGVTIELPHGHGYLYEEGEILSPDGHCRAFDNASKGTVFGSGAGVVALRRLADAQEDGDHIYAVIKGTAVNNDGAQKVGYLAPSVDGQAACIAEALAVADVDASSIGYVECHGTGTPMGDPIEVAALRQAFRGATDEVEFCQIGSVKTNIGHLDAAAGVASLIKATLALHHREIPATLHFTEPNPALELDSSPFRVADRLTPWTHDRPEPRRACVNSLGVGGTNAFAVLEEAPRAERPTSTDRLRLLTITGRSKAALEANAQRLAQHLRADPDVDLADVEWTLREGRHHFSERRVLAARTTAEAADLLESNDPSRSFAHSAGSDPRSVVFMFPGGGTQHPHMAADLYATEPSFADQIDEGLRLLEADHGLELRSLLFPSAADRAAATASMQAMSHQLPLIFLVEHALATLLMQRGVEPRALVGHSLGENTAACVSGTISFRDCLGLVVLRGRLMDRVSGGAFAIPLKASDLEPLLLDLDLDLAVANTPDLHVVSGPVDRLEQFGERLRADGIDPIRVPVTTAVHSRQLDPVLGEFDAYLRSIELRPPSIPWVSNRTGTWITEAEATDPRYWVDHLRHTVLFSDCIATLATDPGLILLEVGPGRSLSSLVRAHPDLKASQVAIPAMRHPDEIVPDDAYLLTAIGRIWAVGGSLPTLPPADEVPPARIALPTYAFQTQPFKIEPGAARQSSTESTTYIDREADEGRWYWKPVWRSQDLDEPPEDRHTWLVIVDQPTVTDEVIERLRGRGDEVILARCGDSYQAFSEHEYQIAPELGLGTYENLVRDLVRTGHVPDRIAHLALLAADDSRFRPGSSFFHRNQELGFQSLVLLAQAWASSGPQRPLHITVATMGAQRAIESDRPVWPEQSTVLGPVLVIPREFEGVTVSTVDLDPREIAPVRRLSATVAAARSAVGASISGARTTSNATIEQPNDIVTAVVDELLASPANERVAIRGHRRLVHDVRRVSPSPSSHERSTLRHGGVVVITGGLGGIGLTVAESLVDSHDARVALMSRTALPDRSIWEDVVRRLGPDHPTTERINRVKALEASGAEVMLLTCDVTDVVQTDAALASVRERFGGIDAVIHAAGTVADDLIVAKPQTDMEDVLAPKVYGTLVLHEATSQDDLELFVVFSSTSTVSAPMGQVDYVAANAFLNAWAASRRSLGEQHVLALNWGVWQDVGMAAASSQRSTTPSGDGPDDPASRRPAVHPFFDAVSVERSGTVRIHSTWSARDEWFLDEHRTASGQALLPGSGYLELARAALTELGFDRPFEIRGLTFLRPLAVSDDTPLEVESVLVPTEQGYTFTVRERVVLSETPSEGAPRAERRGWRRTAEASLFLYQQDPRPRVDLETMSDRCPERVPEGRAQEDHLRFGPRWDVVTRVQRGADDAMAWLHLSDDHLSDLDQIGLHPALVDMGTGFALNLVEGYTGDTLWVPLDYHQITVFGPVPQDVVAIARPRPTSSEASGFATFDVTMCGADGAVVLLISGFTMKRLAGPLDVGVDRRVLPSELEPERDTSRPVSRSERVFQHNLTQGIRPDEGKRAFTTAVASGEAILYVTSIDLHELKRQSESAAAAQLDSGGKDSSAVFGRPDLASEYLEPRNDIEASLVAVWQDLLGIDQVGVRDNFFDLGGHSLIAVRLFAHVKRTFGVEFPISVLFEAPTIEACAGLIADALPEDAVDEAESDDAPSGRIAATRPRYRHLVAMHPGDGGPKPAFFLVAGMFGNVLNLRHLAHLIGTDRPFYGVQARGIYGEEPPHEDFIEMASVYVEEVQQAQPRGPYLLGGFSGGGITALEMARILKDKGEDVGLLVMLDTPIPQTPHLTPAEKIGLHTGLLRTQGASYIKQWASSRLEWEREVRMKAQHGPAVSTDDGTLNSQVVMEAFYRALDRYELRHYPGAISLYRPKQIPLHVFGPGRQIDENRRFMFPDNGWGPHCDEVRVTEVPGNHDSMVLEPSVRVLASQIRAELDRLDRVSHVQPGVDPIAP